MEKTILEKRITHRAEVRFDSDWKDLVSKIERHPIGCRLRIQLTNGNKAELAAETGTPILRGRSPENNDNTVKITNYSEVREALIKEYEAEETINILNKLENDPFS